MALRRRTVFLYNNMNILDELIVPAPPYRMARPVAILAMSGAGETVAGGNEQIVPVVTQAPEAKPTVQEIKSEDLELVLADSDKVVVEAQPYLGQPGVQPRVDAIVEGKRALIATTPDSADVLPESLAVDPLRLSPEATLRPSDGVAPVDRDPVKAEQNVSGVPAVQSTPEAPDANYPLSEQARGERDRALAKQAALRAQGKSKEADKMQAGIDVYAAYEKNGTMEDQKRKAVSEKAAANKIAAAVPEVVATEQQSAAVETPIEMQGPEVPTVNDVMNLRDEAYALAPGSREQIEAQHRYMDAAARQLSRPQNIRDAEIAPAPSTDATPSKEANPADPSRLQVIPGESIRKAVALAEEKKKNETTEQGSIADEALSKGELKQKTFDAKTLTEKKKQITRDETAAIVEDWTRTKEKRLLRFNQQRRQRKSVTFQRNSRKRLRAHKMREFDLLKSRLVRFNGSLHRVNNLRFAGVLANL